MCTFLWQVEAGGVGSSWTGNFLALDWHIGKDQVTKVLRYLPQLDCCTDGPPGAFSLL